ncbi:MAG: GDP-mannose mannosyl hydrolase [Gammaproteobacteria bacterium]|nr:GDP-mannose mannosyl hydrolase [Gammaproteobacteria bacterium]MCK5262610.1 GDP-mannose mannosyl hydrolase [Gammaproteobacteria bacterium]
MINDEQFLKVIDATPLVSIDLIIENSIGEILLGKRLNRPAQDYWFVLGGRIRKNEKIADAFTRISKSELSLKLSLDDAQLLGAYNHIYDDNYLDKDNINTHYVVLGYKLKLNKNLKIQPDDQHSELKWWPLPELMDNADVHPNTKAYFG